MAGRFSIEGIIKLQDRFTRPMSKMDTAVAKFKRRATKGFQSVDRAFTKVSQGIRRGGVMIAGAMVAAGFAIRNVVQSGSEFEQAITNVGAVSLKTREQIAALEEKALALGATTKFTATETANAMEVMARAGFSSTQILSGIDGVLAGAAASGEELADVAGIVSDALKGMGLEADQSGRVVDVLALASSKTKSTMGSLGESLKNVASTARTLGVPLEDTVAAVALLQDVGLDASVAGSALNVMLTKLAKPPKAIAKQMKKMGISFKDANGDMLPFAEVIEQISIGANKMGGNFDKVAFLADLVGLRGQKAAVNLAHLFESGKLKTLTEELGNAEGAAQKMADLRMNTLQGDLTLLDSAIDGVKTSLFRLEGGPLRGVVQGMTDWIGKNKEVITSKVGEFIKSIRDNLPEIVTNLKRVGIAFLVFQGAAIAVKAVGVGMALIGAAGKVAAAGTWLFNLALAANPVAVTIAVIIAGFLAAGAVIVGIGVLIFKFWDDIVVGAGIAMDFVTGAFSAAWDTIRPAVVAVAEFIVGVFEALFPGITATVMSTAKDVVEIWDFVSEAFGEFWSNTSENASNAVTDIKAAFQPIVDWFQGIWDSVAKGFSDVFGGIFGAVSKAFSDTRAVGRAALGGDSDSAPLSGGMSGGGGAGDGVISSEDRAARIMSSTISETMSTERSMSEVTIKDETGRAEVTRQSGGGAPLKLQSSGVF